MTYSMLIIGLGRSGSRFVRAAQCLNHNIKLKAVADNKVNRVEVFRQNGIAAFPCYRDALEAEQFDIIVNCLNEEDHYAFFKYIAQNSISYQRILSEKPLTETLHQAKEVVRLFDEKAVSINFVERYSPIIENIHKKLRDDNLTIVRANFFWGKYRIHDHRPTMGILSEMSHPIDLITWLAQVKPGTSYQLKVGIAISSDFSPHSDCVLDSVTAGIFFNNGLLVTGTSSFVWEGRDRRIELFLSNKTGEVTQLLTLRFDSPLWDIDHLSCYDLQAQGGKPVKLWTRTVEREEIPVQMFSIHKIVKFLEENLFDLQNQRDNRTLAYLNQGVYVQQILEDIVIAANNSCFHKTMFRNGSGERYIRSPRLDEHEEALSSFASRDFLDRSLTWDDGL